MISDKLYIFKGESISEGPDIEGKKIESGYLNVKYFTFFQSSDIKQKNPIIKKGVFFHCDDFLEVQKRIFLYNFGEREIYILDISQTKIEKKNNL